MRQSLSLRLKGKNDPVQPPRTRQGRPFLPWCHQGSPCTSARLITTAGPSRRLPLEQAEGARLLPNRYASYAELVATIETLDGPLDVDASDKLLTEVENALGFWYAYGRHPYRSLSGMPRFMITTSDFRYVRGSQFWRFTLEQAEAMLRELWPDEAAEILKILGQASASASASS